MQIGIATKRKYKEQRERGRHGRQHLRRMVGEGHFLEVTLSLKSDGRECARCSRGENIPGQRNKEQEQRPKGRKGQSVSEAWRGGPCGCRIVNECEKGDRFQAVGESDPPVPCGLWLESWSPCDGHWGRIEKKGRDLTLFLQDHSGYCIGPGFCGPGSR